MDVLAVSLLPFRADGVRTFQIGGAIVMETLLAELAEQGHRVRVIAEAAPRPAGVRRTGVAIPGVEVDWFALEFFPGHLPPAPGVLERERARLEAALVPVLAESRPDVALIGRDAAAWYVPEMLRAAGVPSILVAQGVPTGGYEAGLFPADAERELVALTRATDHVVTVAHHLERVLRDRGVSRVTTIENAIDSRRFRPAAPDRARFGIGEGGPVVAHICGLLDGKRIDDLVASAALVRDAEPEVRYLVTGAGQGLERARAAARARGVDEVFRWLGDVDHADMPALLNAADVMVHTSEREGAPLTYREAQGCELPVVATDIPAAREAMVDGRTGVLYPVGDVAALTAETVRLLRDPAARAALGRAGREAVELHDVPSWTRMYVRLMEEVADRAPAGATG